MGEDKSKNKYQQIIGCKCYKKNIRFPLLLYEKSDKVVALYSFSTQRETSLREASTALLRFVR